MHTKRLMNLMGNPFFWVLRVILGVAVFSPALSQAQQPASGKAPGQPHAAEYLIFEDANIRYCLKQELALLASTSKGDQEEVASPERVDDYNSRCGQFYLMLPSAERESAARLVLIHAPFTPGARMLHQKLSILCRQRPGLMTPFCPAIGCNSSTC